MPVFINSHNESNLPKVLLIILLVVAGSPRLSFVIDPKLGDSPQSENLLKKPETILFVGQDVTKSTKSVSRIDSLVLAFINPDETRVSFDFNPWKQPSGIPCRLKPGLTTPAAKVATSWPIN